MRFLEEDLLAEDMLKDLAEDALKQPRYPDPDYPPSQYYKFLYLLALKMEPRLCVELGVSGGGGSLHLCMGSEPTGGMVVGVDHAWDMPGNIKKICDKFPNYRFQLSDSIAAAPMIYDIYGEIDILFLDTDHTGDSAQNELEAYKPFLSKNAIVCFDDLFRPGVARAWNNLAANKLRLDHLHVGGSETDGGFGVAWWVK